MKKLFILAAAAAMLAGCSETDELAKNQLSEVAEDGAVSFSVYTNRATRAGEAGVMTTDALKGTAEKPGPGFGIFAYHTNNSKYDERTSTPNFMYNQQVKWEAAKKWTYDPVKYWPNEFGKNALSEDIDYVTFFAYAPYVAVSPTTGIPVVDYNGFDAEQFAQFLGYKAEGEQTAVADFQAKEGYKDAGDAEEALKMLFAKQQQGKNVTVLSRNADKGDPIVNYVVDTNPQTSVDLLWGVAAKDNGFKGLAAPEATVTEGNCYLDLSKQIGVSDSIKWRFYHALAKLNVQIIAASDIATQGTASYAANGADALAKATKIYLRSIDFTGFAMRGALNLHSEPVTTEYKLKPNWMNFDGTDLTASTVTFYDGLKDGKEGYTDNINTNEKPQGLNPVLIEEPTTTTWAKKNQGIPTQQYANLFAGAKTADDAVFVIPTNERMTITVIYDVMTRDTLLNQNLSDGFTKGSRVQNKISQTLKDLKLEAGKAYSIKLVVGIESVKIDVKVEPWDTTEAAKDVDLPYNPGEGTSGGGNTTYRMAAAATADDQGKLICQDGHIHAYGEDADCAAMRVALIIYVGSETDDDTYKHGLALALWDSSSSKWENAITNCSARNLSVPVTNASWMLPSRIQWRTMAETAGDKIILRDKFQSVGGRNLEATLYWSSTSAGSWAYSSDFRNAGGTSVTDPNYSCHVRACLAF